MPTFYNYTENGLVYSFDDVFVPVDAFREGNTFGWGQNIYGQIGNNNTTSPILNPVPPFTGGANWKQVACKYHTAAIKTDGTLWTWGRNIYGQLGDNTATQRWTPVTTFAGGTNWKQVACGTSHTAAIKTDGTLWTWGYNLTRQLGDNTGTTRSTPVTTFGGGTNWKQVACGNEHTSAIKTNGTLWSWGNNVYGQLGLNNTTSPISSPTQIYGGGTDWKQVSCGYAHTAAIKTDGTLWCWGSNGYRQSGYFDNLEVPSLSIPWSVGGTDWKQVACGFYHTAAIKTDGTLWSWGRNDNGQLGINNTLAQFIVQEFFGGTNWKQVAGGQFYTAAIKTDGTLWTWGNNDAGQLGDNTQVQKNTPVQTSLGGSNWKQVACGVSHTAAVTYIDDFSVPEFFWLRGEQDFGSQLNGAGGSYSAGIFTSGNIIATSSGSTSLSFTFTENDLGNIQSNTSYIKLYKNSSLIFTFRRNQGLTSTYSVSYNTNDIFYFETELYVNNSLTNPGIGTIEVNTRSRLVYAYTMSSSLD
jgi:hypothetical protein